jgi:hypothetical protein
MYCRFDAIFGHAAFRDSDTDLRILSSEYSEVGRRPAAVAGHRQPWCCALNEGV